MKRKTLTKIIIIAAVAGGIAAFNILHLDQYFTLSYLKASREKFALIYSEHRVAVIAAYMGLYITSTALSLPGALILTLAGGTLFGLLTGIVVVSFSSAIGATAACFVSRFILRDWVQAKFSGRISRVNKGIEREGPFYLFTLRLIPLFPFWLINLAMGLTNMRFRTFYWVSQVGMLPATIIYVNAGKELGKIESLSGILSPGLIISFVLIGLFPITTKKLIALYRAKWNKRAVQ